MGKSKLSFVATEDLLLDFKKLADLSNSNLDYFLESFKSKDGLSFEETELEHFIDESNLNTESLKSIIAVSEFLFKRFLQYNLKRSDIINELEDLALKAELKISSKKLQKLGEIFEISPELKADILRYENTSGVLPFLESTKAHFDLRAVYNESGTSITGFNPIALIEIKVDSQADNESMDLFKFQVGLKSLKQLQINIEKYIKKLESLNEFNDQIKLE